MRKRDNITFYSSTADNNKNNRQKDELHPRNPKQIDELPKKYFSKEEVYITICAFIQTVCAVIMTYLALTSI